MKTYPQVGRGAGGRANEGNMSYLFTKSLILELQDEKQPVIGHIA